LLTHPQIRRTENFTGGKYAVIDAAKCARCGKCREACRFDAITPDFKADIFSCEGCGLCERVCPAKAIAMADRLSGKWFVSDTKYGTLVHAALGIGEENSGKLVSKVKQAAFDIANASAAQWVIADGPPGTGCPVMAALSGAHLAVVVTEPTLSAIHDMKRAVETASHFNIPSAVIINKWDLNEDNTAEVEKFCKENNVTMLGRISFNQAASEAVAAGVPLVEYGNKQMTKEIIAIWKKTQQCLS
ncbi:MAG TPA: 4Fe-4S binding protein, partial [Elusimicrobiales bacterium]|nr:4Fe-4S binding protein [Elusimicrobiales bacterium]